MAWNKAGTTTLTGTSGTIEVADLPDKKFYMVMESLLDTDTNNHNYFRFGNTTVDTANNYSYRYSTNGGADGTGVKGGLIANGFGFANMVPKLIVSYIFNISGEEKLVITHAVDQNTAGLNAPSRNQTVGKWVNTSNPIDIWQSRSSASGAPSGYSSYAVGSNVSIIGSD